MPGILAHISAAELVSLGLLLVLVVVVAWWAIVAWKRSRITAEELERRRRATLNAKGKMGDATLIEVRDNHLFYSYDVRGVEYTASQDISALLGLLPTGPEAVNGVVYVKYDARNPANSIILCEGWSGIRDSQNPQPGRLIKARN